MRQPSTLDGDADSIIGNLHDVGDDAKPLTPERALWLSVVALAWADAFGITPDAQIRYSDSRFRRDESTMLSENDTAISVEAYRASCRNWLIQDFGKWKADREFVADLADIDPDILRTQAKAKLREIKAAQAEGRMAKRTEIDRAFEALISRSEGMDSEALDMALEAIAALESQAA